MLGRAASAVESAGANVEHSKTEKRTRWPGIRSISSDIERRPDSTGPSIRISPRFCPGGRRRQYPLLPDDSRGLSAGVRRGYASCERLPAHAAESPPAHERRNILSERINRQIILAARPQGEPKESDFRLVETPGPGARPGPDAPAHALPVAGPLHAGPDERRPVVRPAGRDRPGHGRRDRLAGSRPRNWPDSSPATSWMPTPAGRTTRSPTAGASASSIRASPR